MGSEAVSQLEPGRLHVFSDFDGTITDKDTLVFLAENLGGGPEMVRAIGRLIHEDKISLRDGIAAEMRSIRAPFSEAVRLLRDQVSIDPGFPIFAKWCAAEGVPLTVVSAGFRELIDLFLPAAEYPLVKILANRLRPDEKSGWQCEFRDETPFGHDKSRALIAARERGYHLGFIGDGLSDRAPAEVADEVFAKHNLAEYCSDRGISFRAFERFDEVRENLIERLKLS